MVPVCLAPGRTTIPGSPDEKDQRGTRLGELGNSWVGIGGPEITARQDWSNGTCLRRAPLWRSDVNVRRNARKALPDSTPESDPTAGQVSGLFTMMLMAYLEEKLTADALVDLLRRAGDSRRVEELKDMGSWSTFDQFKRLLEEAARLLGFEFLVNGTFLSSSSIENFDMAANLQAFDSPGELLRAGGGTNPLMPMRRYEMTEVGQTEWTIREWFIEGFAPYPEYCAFFAGQYAMIPMYLGLPAAEVVEEQCQCRGDEVCIFRMRWERPQEGASREEYHEMHSQLLEARLDQLKQMITDVASNERYEDALQGIVRSARRAILASAAVMALEARAGSPRSIYSDGLTVTEAELLADGLLGSGAAREGVIAVEVVSARRRYGVLAIDERGGIFSSQAQSTLQTYAELAAAALDAADAIEDARHQANTARVLLELSTSLAEVVGTEETAAKVARAVPGIIDCDRAAVFLDNPDSKGAGDGELTLVASLGLPDDAVHVLGSMSFVASELTLDSEYGLLDTSRPSEVGNAATVAAPITLAGKVIGCVVAGVTTDPERLVVTARLAERLKGLAAQASIAINNARLVDQIRFQALHDPLTGLPNRGLILDRTEQMLARARRTNEATAVLFIDLDGFKGVNDTLGHAAGDQLLCAVTARLAHAMRESDSIGRLGGDEFIVLVDGATMDAGPELVAERLLAVLRAPFDLEGLPNGPLTLTASIGIAAGLRASATELLRDADIALYEAKTTGKDRFVIFHPEMHTVVQDRLLLEMDLRDAFVSGQYFLLYQPIFNLASGETIGVEALLRWRHPDRGVVQPDAFISVLEDSGMIVEVGRWVLQEACRQGARWQAGGHRLNVSVNVSTRQLETDHLIEDVSCALETSGFDARSLIVEITETAIMRNVSTVVPRLTALKATGVRIAIDDFGTGYSSLAYLQRFPVDILKIDRSFISTMADSPESGALIRSLVHLGKSLGLETLAEGIEETAQFDQLKRAHCDSGQGYLYARPLDPDAVEAFLTARSGIDVVSSPEIQSLRSS
jgi:diguanylate cyclase (GGDEF)-like protein